MKKSETTAVVAALRAAFPNAKLVEATDDSPGTEDAYAEFLSDLPTAAVVEAIAAVAKSSRFFPTIAEIRETVVERTLGLPNQIEAWQLANERAFWRPPEREDCHRCAGGCYESYDPDVICSRCRGSGDEPAKPPELNPVVRAALDYIGGPSALRESEMVSVLRAQFRDAYVQLRGEVVQRSIESGGFDVAALMRSSDVAAIQRRAELTDGGER